MIQEINMEEKTLTILEYDKIIERLCGFASSDAGRAFCAGVKPSSNYRHIKTWQKNTSDACDRIRLSGSAPSFRGVREIGDILKRLEVAATLSVQELMTVSSVLTAADRVYRYGSGRDEEHGEDSLSEMFGMIEPLTNMNREIQRCILSEDEIADDASAGLLSVRRRLKQAASDIHDAMASKLNAYRDYLTDAVITQRDGRYCLPVKAEYKSKVPGMVHDMSSTGMTLFIEPMAVVNLNNRIRELMSEEQKEIDKVLQELSAGLAPYTDVIADDISLLKKLDMIFAKALYSAEIGGTEPQFSKDLSIDLRSARHPLIEKDKVVPIDVRLGRDYDLLIVTGPNTGGKTVSLKTTGLLTLMGQSGLHIPADEGSVLGIFDDIYADIGDEQSIEQSLSTFSSHMKNIVRILKKADSRSLCLFDELGSGTDPTEGAALGIAILDFLHNMKTRVMATTHYSEIKLYALETEGVENACCEFDVQTLKPTYRLLIGIPGRSNAFAISKRLGLPDYIIEEAKRHIAAENESFEDIIRQLNDDRVRMEKAKAETEAAKQEISSLRGRIRKKEERLDESREKILNEAREEAQKILREAKETADMAIREIQKASSGKERAGASDAEAARDLLREGIKKHETRQPVQQKGPSRPVSARKLQLGDEVRVLSMGGMTGTVTALPDKDGIISVQLGFMNSRVNVREIELVKEADKNGGSTGGRRDAGGPKTASGGVTKSFGMKSMTVSPEINLIGMTTDEALPELEKYLDDAYLARLSSVRVVHGRGTGALKNMVHQRLRKLKYVDSFRLGTFGEGDTGVTIVTFK